MAEAYTAVTLSPLRRIIAARMTEAKQTIPHFRLVADIEIDALLQLRRELQERSPEAKLSLNDFLVKACASTLIDVPAINIQWAQSEIRQCHRADISIVVALEGGGLLTPIIRAAESKTVWEISGETKELASRAKRNALKMDEIMGGSFSVSNLGMYGIDQFDAIINPPQCAILAVGSAKPKVVVSKDGEASVAIVMRATLSVDHRAIDGVIGASFLAALRDRIEQPDHLRPRGAN